MRDTVVIGPGGRRPRPEPQPRPQPPAQPLLRTTLGYLLRRARWEQNRTLADVARAARVSLPYLSELERGRKEASSEILAAMCGALRIELSDLLAEAGRSLAADRAGRALIEERARRRCCRSRAVSCSSSGPAARAGSAAAVCMMGPLLSRVGSRPGRGFPPRDPPCFAPCDLAKAIC